MVLDSKLQKTILKDFLYRSILEDVEEKYEEKCLEDGYADIDDVIVFVLDQKTDDLMENFYDLEKNEDDLKEIIHTLLVNDFDNEGIDSYLSEGGRYNGLSVRERNPFLQ